MASLRVGRLTRLRSDHHGAFLAVEGFTDLTAKKNVFRSSSPEEDAKAQLKRKANEEVFQVVAVADEIPLSLYTAGDAASTNAVDVSFQKIANAPRLLAEYLSAADFSRLALRDLQNLLIDQLRKDDRIAALCIAFEPGQFKRNIKFVAPYVTRDVADPSLPLVRHYADDYTERDWFRVPKLQGQGWWSEPFNDEDSGNVPMVSYSVPLRKEGQFIGVVKMHIALDLESSKPRKLESFKPMHKIELDSGSGGGSKGGEEQEKAGKKGRSEDAVKARVLDELAEGPRLLAHKIGALDEDSDMLRQWMTQVLQDVRTHGILVAYEPRKFSRQLHSFAMHARRDANTGEVGVQEWHDDYISASWYQKAIESRAPFWTAPTVLDESKKDVGLSVISYVAPFFAKGRGNRSPIGVICLDVRFDKNLFADLEGKQQEVRICASCGLRCNHCYYTNTVSLSAVYLCLRCFVDGVMPEGTTSVDYRRQQSREYSEWLTRYRRGSAEVLYGQKVQFMHVKSGRFLSVNLKPNVGKDVGLRSFYELALEKFDRPDPYLEGSESTWFTLLPSSDARTLGESVIEGDQVRVVSTRWQWDISFDQQTADGKAPLPTIHTYVLSEEERAKKKQLEKKMSSRSEQWSLSSQLHWKIMPYGVLDEDLSRLVAERGRSMDSGVPDAIPVSTADGAATEADSEVLQQTRVSLVKKQSQQRELYGLANLEAPSASSIFLRDGDLIRVRSSTSSEALAAFSHFHREVDSLDRSDPEVLRENRFVYYGRYTYSLAIQDEANAYITGCWKIEVVTAPSAPLGGSRAGAASREADSVALEQDATAQTEGVVTWGTRFRLRHVLSHRHLAVGRKGDSADEQVAGAGLGGGLGFNWATTVDLAAISSHGGADELSQVPHVFQFRPVKPQGKAPNDVVTVSDPFYLAVVDDPTLPTAEDPHNPKPEARFWLNVAAFGATFTSYRDEEDAYNAVKSSMRVQKAIYFVRQAMNAIDATVERLYKKFALPAAAAARRSDAERYSSPEAMDYCNRFCTDNRADFLAIDTVLLELQRFLISMCNRVPITAAELKKVIGDPAHEQGVFTGLTVRWRQELLLEESIVPRIYAIFHHPVFQIVHRFPSVVVKTEKVRRDTDDGGASQDDELSPEARRAKEEAALAEAAKQRESDNQQLCLQCFRDAAQLGCIMCIDFPNACVQLLEDRARTQFLLDMLTASALHRLGVQRLLAMVFEHGRKRIATLTLEADHLAQLYETWNQLIVKKKTLEAQLENADMNDPIMIRDLQSRDANLYDSCHNFLRVLASLGTFGGIPDPKNQRLVLDSLVAEYRKHMAMRSADGSSHVDKLSHAMMQKRAGKGYTGPRADVSPSALNVLLQSIKGAPLHYGHGILANTEALRLQLGLDELAVDFDSLLRCVSDESRSLNVRARYCQLLTELYVKTKYPRMLVNLTPLVKPPGRGGSPEFVAVSPSQGLIRQHSVTRDASGLRPMSYEQSKQVWTFVLHFLGKSAELNTLTLPVLNLVYALMDGVYEPAVALDDPLSPSDASEQKHGASARLDRLESQVQMDLDEGVAEGSQLSQLAIFMLAFLKTKIQRADGVSDSAWTEQQRYTRDVIFKALHIMDIIFDYRLNQHMKTFFSIASLEVGLAAGGAGPADDTSQKQHESRGSILRSPQNSLQMLSISSQTLAAATASRLGVMGEKLQRLVSHKDVRTAADVIFSAENDIFFGGEYNKFARVLINLIRSYDDRSIVMAAFGLLQREHKQAFDLISAVERCLVLESEEQVLRASSLRRAKHDLFYLMRVEFLAKEADDVDTLSLNERLPQICGILDFFLSVFVAESSRGQVSDYSSRRRAGSVANDVSVPGLRESRMMLADEYRDMQNLVRIIGIHEVLLDILSVPFPDDMASDHPLLQIFRRVYDVLILWADENGRNKKKLEKHLRTFFLHCFVGPAPSYLLTIVMGRNAELCGRLSKSVLQDYLAFLASSDESWTKSAVPVQLLKTLVRVEGHLIKLNAIIVVKAVCEHVNILGHLGMLTDPAAVKELVQLFNFRSSNPLTLSDADRFQLERQQYYLELLALLSRCTPPRYTHFSERSKREAEESVLLCRAAMPIGAFVELICGVKDATAKIHVVRFFEQLYADVLARYPNETAKLLTDFHRSASAVAYHFYARGPGGSDAFKVHDVMRARRKYGAVKVDEAYITYVFDVVLPMLTAYYHTTFRVHQAPDELIKLSNKLLCSVADLSRQALDRTGADAIGREAEDTRQLALILDRSHGLENALNLIIHMRDPGGHMGSSRQGVTGKLQPQLLDDLVAQLQNASSGKGKPRVDEAVPKGGEEEEKGQGHFISPLVSPVASAQAVASGDGDAGAGGVQSGNQALMEYFNRVLDSLKPFKEQEQLKLNSVIMQEHANESLLRKVILLVGDFVADEAVGGTKHKSGIPWIDANSSRFAQTYLRALQYSIEERGEGDEERVDQLRRMMVDLALPRIIISLVSRSHSLVFIHTALSLANALLNDGFYPAQTAFRARLQDVGSHSFFTKLRDILALRMRVRSKAEIEEFGGSKWPPVRYSSWPLLQTLLRFLQLLCEGHNLEWQRTLNSQQLGMSLAESRGQAGGATSETQLQQHFGVSVNLISETSSILQYLVDLHGPLWYIIVYWNRWYDTEVIARVVSAAQQTLATLIEVMQGPCDINQVELARGRFIESVNWILDAVLTAEQHSTDPLYGDWSVVDVVADEHSKLSEMAEVEPTLDRRSILLELQRSLVTALKAMLEGNVDPAVPRRILSVFNFSAMEDLISLYLDRAATDDKSLIGRLNPLNALENIQELGQKLTEGLGLLDTDVLRTLYKSTAVDYFIFVRILISRCESAGIHPPYPFAFQSFLKSKTYRSVDAEFGDSVGQVEILRDGRLELVLFEIPEVVMFQRQTPSFRSSADEVKFNVRRENQHAKLDDFQQSAPLLIYELTSHPRIKRSWLVRGFDFFTDVTFPLAILLNILSVVDDGSVNMYTHASEASKVDQAALFFAAIQIVLSFFRLLSVLASHAPIMYYKYRQGREEPRNWHLGATWNKGIDGFIFGIYFLTKPKVLYQVLYLVSCFLGLANPVAYSFQLLDFVQRSAMLKQVFSSLASFVSTLVAVAILWLILMYAYASVGFAYFKSDYGEEKCSSKLHCIMYTVTEGLRAGETIETPPDWGSVNYYTRAIFDVSYFLILNLVMLAVVTGIIIDAFGASRDEKEEKDADQTGQCFICGIESSLFDRKKSFDQHYHDEHNMWNYVYFLAYLALKDENEYTGQESYVAEMVAENKIDWFPIGRAAMLEDGAKGDSS